MKTYTLAELAAEVSAEIRGPNHGIIRGLGTLLTAGPEQLTFLANPKYRTHLATSQAGAVLCRAEDAAQLKVPALVVKDPYLAFAKLSQLFSVAPKAPVGVHPSAVVAETARLGAGVSLGAGVVVEADAVLGEGVVVQANSVIGEGVELGANVRVYPNVTLYHGVIVGEGTVIHAGSVIGADGFGFAFGEGRWHSVAQVGGVRIGRNVNIGANVTIDRGAIDDTVVGDGVILDDQVHLGHNVTIGEHSALAGKAGISGSSHIGRYCMIGGAVGLAGHLTLADKVNVLGMTLVSKSLTQPGTYGSALPADNEKRWRRNTARFRKLDELYRRVVALEKQQQNHE